MSKSRIIFLIIFAVIAVFMVMIFLDFGKDKADLIPISEAAEGRTLFEDHQTGSAIADNGLNLALIMIIGAGAAALLFSIFNLISEPKKAIKLLGTIAILGVIVAIGYFMASDEVTENFVKKGMSSASGSKWIGGWLNTVYIMGGVAIVGALASEVMAVFR